MPVVYSSEYCNLISELSIAGTPRGAQPYRRSSVLSLAADSSTKTSISGEHPPKFMYHRPRSVSFRYAAIRWVTFRVNAISL